VRPSITSDKVHVHPIRINVLLTLDMVNLDLLCPRWLPHCCHVGWSGLLRAHTLAEGHICLSKGRIRLSEGRIRLPKGCIRQTMGRIRWRRDAYACQRGAYACVRGAYGSLRGAYAPPRRAGPPPLAVRAPSRMFVPSPLPCAPPIHARNAGVEIHLTFECAMSTYSINEG
jgi:hypothetical protein